MQKKKYTSLSVELKKLGVNESVTPRGMLESKAERQKEAPDSISPF